MQPQEIIPFLDYTSLGAQDSEQTIAEFLKNAYGAHGKVAAVCVYPQFVAFAKKILQKENIPVATVVNFPKGNSSLEAVLAQTKSSLQDGADEIDLVCQYKDYLLHEKSDISIQLVQKVKKLCKGKILKVILETGALKSSSLIQKASKDAILSGADFLKTSTGKTEQGASLEAVRAMLEVIKASPQKVGLKISGGVKTYCQTLDYIHLIKELGLQNLFSPATFRIGASSLLADLIKHL